VKIDLNNPEVRAWLEQFPGDDEGRARRLLEGVRLVTADELQAGLTKLIVERGKAASGPVGLFAERSIRTRNGKPNRLFKESTGKIKRAFGAGPEPVKSKHAGRHETGSEGIIATLVTNVTRKHKAKFLNHPGPDLIRSKQVRRFMLVTDFVGTGSQAGRYLDAAWRLASVKSWVSGKFLAFEVVCFSATGVGIARLSRHPCKPTIYQVEACPTLDTYAPYEGQELTQFCIDYGPLDSETGIPRLGYGNVGALIAFAHGVPNNGPRLLFANGKKWAPLFASRVTGGAEVGKVESADQAIRERLRRLAESKLAASVPKDAGNLNIYVTGLVLSALKRKPRTPEVVSARTGLSLSECVAALERVRAAGWIDVNNRLLAKAYIELQYLRSWAKSEQAQLPRSESLYCPQQLRVPKGGV